MRKFALALTLFVALFSVICLAKPFTLVPWPYGVIALVQTPSIDQQQFVDDATRAVKDVFSFWDLPVPAPDTNWATPTQTSSQAWWNMAMQHPEMLIGGGENPFLSPMQLAFGTAYPGDDPEHELIVPYPVWSGWKIMPLTLGVFPSGESMNNLVVDYTFSASFGGLAGYTMLRSERSWTEDEQEILHLFWDRSSIIMSAEGDKSSLSHEISHWAAWLWCQEHGVQLFSLPRLITEGFADYTADSLTHDDSWRTIGAAWAQQGGNLADVPRQLLYEVGASVISLLVQEKGKKGLLEMLADPTVDWSKEISSLTPAWRRWLAAVSFSTGDLARYEAVLEDLALCNRLLAPVLPQEAYEVLKRLYDGRGTIQDIDHFWDLVSQVPPEPSEEIWQAMIARIPSFLIVQAQDSDPDIRMVRARLEIKLDKYSSNHDWKDFYETFIEGLRDVVAHYGIQKATDAN